MICMHLQGYAFNVSQADMTREDDKVDGLTLPPPTCEEGHSIFDIFKVWRN